MASDIAQRFAAQPRAARNITFRICHTLTRRSAAAAALAGPASFDIFAIVIGALDKQKDRSQKQENWPKIPVATSKVNPEQPSAPILGCLLVAACGRPNREM